MITLVCGLSKSGKTTLIQRAEVAAIGLKHLKASSALKSEGRPINRLRAVDVEANQKVLVSWMLRYLSQHPLPVLLDGHLLIETEDGPQLVPDVSLASLPLTGVIFIHEDPIIIAQRRLGFSLTRSPDEIADLMQIEASQASRFARIRQVPFTSVRGTDVKGLVTAIQGSLRPELQA